MTTRSQQPAVHHATFTVERTYNAPVERVFRALTDPEVKRLWFSGPPEWGPEQYEGDFREGGREVSSGGPPGGPVHRFESHIWDVVPNERVIITYQMHLDDTRISVSLQSIELESVPAGTLVTLTEHGAYLDGTDGPEGREQGTRELLDAMAAVVEQAD